MTTGIVPWPSGRFPVHDQRRTCQIDFSQPWPISTIGRTSVTVKLAVAWIMAAARLPMRALFHAPVRPWSDGGEIRQASPPAGFILSWTLSVEAAGLSPHFIPL